MDSFEIKRLDKSTIDQQIEVYIDSFNLDDSIHINQIRETWNIKHFENPIADSFIFGAYDGGELVGINAFLNMTYIYKGKRYRVLQSCESGVKSTHQRKGIWKKIMEYAVSYFEENKICDFLIGFPNYVNSYPGFVKLNWKTISNLSNFIFINNGKETVRAFLGIDSSLCRLFSMQKLFLCSLKENKYSVKEYSNRSFDKKQWYKQDSVALEVNEAWLRWRVKYKKYNIYTVYYGFDPVLNVVIDKKSKNNVTYYEIIKFFLIDESFSKYELMKHFLLYLTQKKDCNFIRMSFSNNYEEKKLLKKLGFIETKRHPNPFIVKKINDSLFMDNFIWKPSFWELD